MRNTTGRAHRIWGPKRRRVLRDPEGRAARAKTCRAIAEECGVWSDTLAVEADHLHVSLEFPPQCAIARVVGLLKRISASRTCARCGSRRRKFWSGELGEDGYAARTVGDTVTRDLIRRDIQRHTAAQATKQPELF